MERVSRQLIGQSQALEGATRSLSAVGASMDGTIGERQTALEQMAEHLQAKAETLADNLQTVSAVIQDTLANAERRDGYERGRRVVDERLSELDKVLSERARGGFDAPAHEVEMLG